MNKTTYNFRKSGLFKKATNDLKDGTCLKPLFFGWNLKYLKQLFKIFMSSVLHAYAMEGIL